MSEQEQIEGLHQRAAENYLQGQFEDALESWRELLTLDPQDDRAIEGIRLCELIVQQASDNELSPASEAPAPQASLPPPGEGSDVDFDEIESILKESEEAENEIDTAVDPGWDFSNIEVAEPLDDGLHLADLPDLEADPSSPGGDDGFDLPALDMAGPADEAVGNAEVQSRVAELLSQASTSYDAGDVEGAMTLLDRVFILDEQNPAALALADAFREDADARAEPQAGDGPAEDAVADDNLQTLGLATPVGTADGVAGEDLAEDVASLVATPPELAPEDGLLGELDPVPSPESVPPVAKTGGTRKRLLIGVGVVMALGVAAFVGFRMRGSGPAGQDTVAPHLRAAEAAPAADTGDALPEPQAEVRGSVADFVEPAPAEDLAAVMTRAREAFDAGEFSSAVVAYNEALQIEPDSARARSGLAKAAAAYQEQREFMTKLNSATEAFTRNDYREALRLFYRLPGTEGVARFDRFKANGWYNLGIGSLKSGACKDAKSHLQEASALLPGDSGIAAAAKLATACRRSQGDALWYGDVERLPLRSLDD